MTPGVQGGAQVEKALDDLIQRLSKADSTAEVRAALIEARRLRNVTLRWGAIPPPPDARREMMTRVTALVAKAGAAARSQPPAAPAAPASEPSSGPLITVERPPVRALSPFGGQLARPAAAPAAAAAPLVSAPGEFRSNPAGGMTRPRPNGGLPPPKPRVAINELPELDAVAPPRAAPPPLPPRAPAAKQSQPPAPGRNLSPIPGPARVPVAAAVIARDTTPSASGVNRSPIPSLKKEPNPLPVALRMSNPIARRGTAAGLRPIGSALLPEPSPPPPPPSDPHYKKAPTLEFESPASPRPPAVGPRSTSRPLSPVVRPSQPPTPRFDPSEALRAISSAPQMRSRSPHRAHTIAGIPEANEAFLEALRKNERAASEPPAGEEQGAEEQPEARSNMPTAAPPPPSGPPRSTGAPPPLRRSGAAKGTLMMGSINAADALEALRGGRAPVFAGELAEDEPEHDPPITKPSNPENLAVQQPISERAPPMFSNRTESPVPRRPSGTMPAVAMSSPPILAIPAAREGRLDGLSSAVSMPSMASVSPGHKRPSSPTQIMGSSPPPSVRASPDKPLRTVVSPGVTIVRPDAAQWLPHPVSQGVTLKLLFRDPRSGVYTALVRLAPGSSVGRRRHAAAEEMLLVSGIATVGPHEMRAGEYCRAEADTIHELITTSTGCTFFLCGSEHDEFLDDA